MRLSHKKEGDKYVPRSRRISRDPEPTRVPPASLPINVLAFLLGLSGVSRLSVLGGLRAVQRHF
jgi:hypothetical protein